MSYSFTPLSDEQLDAINLIDEGTYSFEVIKAVRKTSKSGNAMAELQLMVWDANGKQHVIYDYLVFSNVNLNIRKVAHFAKAVGLYEEYQKGELPEDLDRLTGKADIGIKEAQPKGDGTYYPKKNVVTDYVNASKEAVKATNDKDAFNDDIPF